MLNLNLNSILITLAISGIVATYAYIKYQDYSISTLETKVSNSAVVERQLKAQTKTQIFMEKQKTIFDESKQHIGGQHETNLSNLSDGNYTYKFN